MYQFYSGRKYKGNIYVNRKKQGCHRTGSPTLEHGKSGRVFADTVRANGGSPRYIGVEPGLESIRQFYQGFLAAFPGCQLIFDDLFAVEDRLACRFVLQGTHGGPFQGLPATGKPIHIPGITILRFVDGKCVERWSQSDFLGLMQQLGMLPTPG